MSRRAAVLPVERADGSSDIRVEDFLKARFGADSKINIADKIAFAIDLFKAGVISEGPLEDYVNRACQDITKGK